MEEHDQIPGTSTRPPERRFWTEEAEGAEGATEAKADPWSGGTQSHRWAPWDEPSGTPVATTAAWWGAAGAGLAAVACGASAYAWWRRQQARRTGLARLRYALSRTSLAPRVSLPEAARACGRAADKTKSQWLPFAMVPIALWLQTRGRQGRKASKEMLKPLKLEKRSVQLARRSAKLVETSGRRWVRRAVPARNRGWSWRRRLIAMPAFVGLCLGAIWWTRR